MNFLFIITYPVDFLTRSMNKKKKHNNTHTHTWTCTIQMIPQRKVNLVEPLLFYFKDCKSIAVAAAVVVVGSRETKKRKMKAKLNFLLVCGTISTCVEGLLGFVSRLFCFVHFQMFLFCVSLDLFCFKVFRAMFLCSDV